MKKINNKILFSYTSKKYWVGIIGLSFLLLVLIYKNVIREIHWDIKKADAMIGSIFLNLAGIYGLKTLFWLLFGSLRIELDDNKLIQISNNGFYKRKRTFLLMNMSDIEVLENEPNGYTWGFQGINFYVRDKEILFFKYSGKEKTIGKKIEGFEAEKLKTEILKRI